MKKALIILTLFLNASYSYSQDRIFSIGYGKTFVTNDSSTFNITFDLNRVPGKTESAGSYYFWNRRLSEKSKWAYYAKPVLDVNLGSTTASAPNNIAVGASIGYAYDFEQGPQKIGLFSLYLEMTPEIVSDKDFTNSLYYFSIGPYIKYTVVGRQFTIDAIQIGLSASNGLRVQQVASDNQYSRLTLPLYVKITGWKSTWKKGTIYEKAFKRINLSTSNKYSVILKDDPIIATKDIYFYTTTKLDIYLTPNLGIGFTYNSGYEEPVFKQNNSYTLGVTLAR